jgi:phosphoribosylformimino-5-aminoimidazole carboxamide ribotide isomerase
MHLVPVVDLLQGQVVRAQRGDRANYRPIVSALCGSSDPLVVARTLCAHCASTRLYVADLDAIQGRAPQAEVLRALLASLPAVELWVDAGFVDAAAANALRERVGPGGERIRPVFGSESMRSRAAFEEAFGPSARAGADALLSLDRRDGTALDPAGCWDVPAWWPREVVVMTLERVGADAGPDLDTLRQVAARSPHTRLIGAGGIRDAADLERARAAGAWAWLVASALHDGRLPARSA